MERFALLVTLSAALVFISSAKEFDFFDKQDAVLEAFQHVYQKNLFNVNLYNESQKFEFDATKYTDPNVFEKFRIEYGQLEKGGKYSILNEEHVNAFVALYKLFMSAKDLQTLYETIAWVRYNVDSYMYIYVLSVVIERRADMQDVFVPAVYEINPYFFFNSIVIEEALSQQMQGYANVKKEDGVYTVVIPDNYTGRYTEHNEETVLSYFTEDPAVNAALYYLNMKYPLWIKGENIKRRGVKFFQFMLARYNMERFANDMPIVQEISWTDIVETGHYPDIRYYDGVQFASRGNNYKVYNKENYKKVDYLRNLESLMVLHFNDMHPAKIHNTLLEYFYYARILLASSDFTHIPGPMMFFETNMRDPMFFQFTRRFLSVLPSKDSYKREDIIFEGVKIDSVEMEKLATFFDTCDFDITNAVDVNGIFDKSTAKSPLVKAGRVAQYEGEDVLIKARRVRLNHAAFNYKINVHSDTAQKAKLIMYIGPKYDELGNVLSLNEIRERFYELDSVTVDLTEGDNHISRSCKDFPTYFQDHTSYYEMRKQLMMARKGEFKYPAKTSNGFPYRLMLPKGRKEGLPVQLFFFITHITDKFFDVSYIKRFSYPLDRDIVEDAWYTPNMYYLDTMIYHDDEVVD